MVFEATPPVSDGDLDLIHGNGIDPVYVMRDRVWTVHLPVPNGGHEEVDTEIQLTDKAIRTLFSNYDNVGDEDGHFYVDIHPELPVELGLVVTTQATSWGETEEEPPHLFATDSPSYGYGRRTHCYLIPTYKATQKADV